MDIDKKVNLYIVNANYPFGKTETFLENEVKFVSNYFEKIYLFPLNYPSKDFTIRDVPENVIYKSTLLDKLYYKRIIKFLLKLSSPIKDYLIDLLVLAKSGNGKYFQKIKGWSISLLVDRTFYKSEQYNYIMNNIKPDDILYFYWGGSRSRYSHYFNHPNTFIRIHGREVDFTRSNNYIVLFNKTFNSKATFLAISDKVKTEILDYFPENKVVINRLGTFDKSLGPNTLSPSSRITRIVSCSNVIPLKRVHLVIEALKEIKDIDIEWVHFGDGVLFEKIKSQAICLSENIKCVFKGRVSNTIVLDYYKNNQVDLFINISTFEGVPVSIMEAFSFGIPCFATNAGATYELLNNTNGVLVPIDFEVAHLTECIRACGTELFKSKRIEARKTWEKYCNAENNYLQLVEIMTNSNKI